MSKHKSITDSDIIVGTYTNTSLLKAVDTSNSADFPSYCRAYVDGVGEYYLNRSSTLSENLPNTISATGGGVWINIGGTTTNNLIKKLSTYSTGGAVSGSYISSSTVNYITVTPGSDSTTSGTALINAYTAAKSLTPNGLPLSATNRATVYLMAGTYKVNDGAFVMDTQFIDLVGIGSRDDIRIESTGNTLTQTANDVHIECLTLYSGSTSSCSFTSTDKAAYFPSTSLANTIIRNVKFSGSISGTTGGLPMRAGITYAGTYEYCDGSDYCFGFNGVASGKFTECIGNIGAFGCGSTAGGNCNGVFNYCRTQTTSTYSFGSVLPTVNGGVGGFCSGSFNYCTAQDNGFAVGQTGGSCSGKFNYCSIVATNVSRIGFAGGNVTGGIAGGVFNYCGGARLTIGFAGGGSTGGLASGFFNNCNVLSLDKCFANAPVTGGLISGTINGLGFDQTNLTTLSATFRATFNNQAIIKNVDFAIGNNNTTVLSDVRTGAIFIGCRIQVGDGFTTGSNPVVTSTLTGQIASFSHCHFKTNPFTANVTNYVTEGFNIYEDKGTLARLSAQNFSGIQTFSNDINAYGNVALNGTNTSLSIGGNSIISQNGIISIGLGAIGTYTSIAAWDNSYFIFTDNGSSNMDYVTIEATTSSSELKLENSHSGITIKQGWHTTITNIGTFSLPIKKISGSTLCTIAPNETWFIQYVSPSTSELWLAYKISTAFIIG